MIYCDAPILEQSPLPPHDPRMPRGGTPSATQWTMLVAREISSPTPWGTLRAIGELWSSTMPQSVGRNSLPELDRYLRDATIPLFALGPDWVLTPGAGDER